MKKLLFISICFCFALTSFGQSQKTVKSLQIKTRTEWTYLYRGNKEIPYKESFKKFDAEGNEIEIIEYDEKGNITLHSTFKFNENNDVIEEVTYNPNGSVFQTDKYTYTGKLKTQRETFDGNGKLTSRKKYIYEFKE